MTHDRDPRITLAPELARCAPSATPRCGRFSCARYLAPLPVGGSLADFNLRRTLGSPPCLAWISAQGASQTTAVAPPRRVHPPLDGSGG